MARSDKGFAISNKYAPLAVGVHLAVLRAAAVNLAHAALNVAAGELLVRGSAAQAALNLRLLVGVDKEVQGVVVLQNDVGAAAHDHAVTLLGEVLDDLALGCGDADGLIHQLDRRHGEAVADGHGVSGLNALFADVSDIALIKAVLLGDHLDDLVIIAGDAQLVGQTLAQLSAAAAEFAADRNNFHIQNPPGKNTCLNVSPSSRTAVRESVFVAAPAHELAHDGVVGDIGRVQRWDALRHGHHLRQAVRGKKFVAQLRAEAGNLLHVLHEDARLVVVEAVDMDGGVALIGLDVVLLAAVDALGALDRLAQAVAAGVIVADHAAHGAQLRRADDGVVVGQNTRAGGDVDAVGRAAELVEDQRIEHVDALGDDDAVVRALHLAVAAGHAALEVVPRDVHLAPVEQLADAGDQQRNVHAVRRLPVRRLGRPLLERQKKVIHTQQTDLHAEVFQIVPQAHGGGGLAGAGGARQRHNALVASAGQDRGRRGRNLIVKDLLAVQDKLRLVAHGIVDVLQINNAHKSESFLLQNTLDAQGSGRAGPCVSRVL